MARTTYKNLFTLVSEQIDQRLTYNTRSQFGKAQLVREGIQPAALSATGTADRAAQEVLRSVSEILQEALPQRIISGLNVVATDPVTYQVIVKAGKGTVGGNFYQLDEDTIVTIPFNNSTSLFYINFKNDGLFVETSSFTDRLTLAKIVVPLPGTTFVVQNANNHSFDAYIIQYQEVILHTDGNGKFEEDSKELLKDNIGDILAETIVGNITLSENLKITNTVGSLVLDSSSIQLFNEEDSVIARFDRRGTFFYDDNSIEIAKFSVDGAHLGNIEIFPNAIQSRNFVSGAMGSGFQILDSGDAQFNNICARGKFSTTVFESQSISAVGGNLLVLNSDTLATDMTPSDTNTLVISGSSSFAINEILRIKNSLNDEWLKVTNCVAGSCTYTVCRDMAGSYIPSTNPAWTKGSAVVSYGTTGAGGLYLTASEANAPYISVFCHVGAPWSTLCTYARFGQLNGFLDYVTPAMGIGIGDSNAYLKYDPVNGLRIRGSVTITGGGSASIQTFLQPGEGSGNLVPTSLNVGDLWTDTCTNRVYRAAAVGATTINPGAWEPTQCSVSPIDSGLYLGANKLGYFNGTCWQTYICNNGNFSFGGVGSNLMCWNGFALCLSGAIVASTNGVCSVQICNGNVTANSILLVDPACTCNYSCLLSGVWYFHDCLGNTTPYVKRLQCGTVCTGNYVCLCGWTSIPSVIVGIKTLNSYKAANAAQDQQWNVYADTPVYWCNSPTDFGYCFQSHACLLLAAGAAAECVKSANFDTCVCTTANTCASCVRAKFQLWCNGACANYFYGTVCYAACYRCLGCGVWCATCFSFVQPHSSLGTIQTLTDNCTLLTFPCGACWEIMLHQVSLTYTDSGFSSAVVTCNLCTRTLVNCTSTQGTCFPLYCLTGGPLPQNCCTCCATSNLININGTNPSNVFCTYLCYCLCGFTSCLSLLIVAGGLNATTVKQTVCNVTCLGTPWGTNIFNACVCKFLDEQTNFCTSFTCCAAFLTSGCADLSACNACTFNNFGFYATSTDCLCCYSNFGCTYGPNCTCSQTCIFSSTLFQCYCSVSGAACTYTCEQLYSLTDTLASQTILDSAGCLNWLAVSYA